MKPGYDSVEDTLGFAYLKPVRYAKSKRGTRGDSKMSDIFSYSTCKIFETFLNFPNKITWNSSYTLGDKKPSHIVKLRGSPFDSMYGREDGL